MASTFAALLPLFPTICLALLVLSLWTTSHYWRTVAVSWLATLSVGHYFLVHEQTSSTWYSGWLGALTLTLLVWSLLLTPFQLILSKPDDREPSATSEILWDPEDSGLFKYEIKAEYVMDFCLISMGEEIFVLQGSHVCSVVAVHGLGSAPERVWLHPVSKVHWLRDLIPQFRKDLRVIAINHHSRWDSHSPVQSLRDYSQVILDAINQVRRDEQECKRPLILIGYSFGGILMKKALVIAHEESTDSRKHQIAQATKSVLFLGTPHRGSNFALLGMMVSYLSYWRGSRTDLLEFLTPSSRELEDLNLSFIRAFEKTRIVNFFENRPIIIRGIPLYLVVSRHSATMNSSKSVALDADHRSMHKFSDIDDVNYKAVRGEIQDSLEFIDQQELEQMDSEEFRVSFRLRGAPVVGRFVGRTDLRRQIERLTLQEGRKRRNIIVLEGLGGIGKTQLAIEFAIRNQQRFAAVFWLDGRNRASLEISLAAVAEQVPIPAALGADGRLSNAPGSVASAINLVIRWFETSGNTRWLILVDDVDNQVFAPGEPQSDRGYDLRQYLPAAAHGTIVLTSRLSRLAQLGHGIHITGMTAEESTELVGHLSDSSPAASGKPLGSWNIRHPNCLGEQFTMLISDLGNSTDIQDLMRRLHGLQLAISHAGTYMQETGLDLSGYLKRFDHQLQSIFRQQSGISYGQNSISSSWQLSMDAIREKDPLAAKLFLLWGCLDNADLWWGLLHSALEGVPDRAYEKVGLASPESIMLPLGQKQHDLEASSSNWVRELAKDEGRFLEAIRVLGEFSFLKQVRGSDGFAIHPLLHQWSWTKIPPVERESYLNVSASILGRAYPLAHSLNAWTTTRRLSPHMTRFWILLDEQPGFTCRTADGFSGLGYFQFDQSDFHRAKTAQDMAAEAWTHSMGQEHTYTVQCMIDRAIARRELGEYEAAESLLGKVLEVSRDLEDVPGRKNYLRALDDLGRLHVTKGEFDLAVPLFTSAMEGKEPLYGADDMITLDSARQLALALQRLGRLDEALPLHLRVLTGFQSSDETSSWSLLAASDLGTLYHRQGQLEQAEALLDDAYKRLLGQLGPENSKTKEAGERLHALYKTLGRDDGANEL